MYHKVILAGNLGRDPEIRYTSNGTPVVNLSVATNNVYTNASGERVTETIWWRVAVWGKQAEAVNQYLHKGSKVLVEGRMTPDKETGGPRTYERNDGSVGASYEVTAMTVRFLDSKGDGASGGGQHQSVPADDLPGSEEEIPF